MMEFAETGLDVRVEPGEYQRLLGYPVDYVPGGRSRELADWAREWYRGHGEPWIYGRRAETFELMDNGLRMDGEDFHSTRLWKTLRDAEAGRVYVVAVGAGPETEREAARRWREEKPDEYFFLDVYGSAVVEYLIAAAGARLCAWADGNGMAVLPHYSPGYPEWDIAEQGRLLRVIERGREGRLPGPLEALESGALRPKKSLLGVFGMTAHAERVRRLAGMTPCEQCSLGGCQYRRTPYQRAPRTAGAFPVGGRRINEGAAPVGRNPWSAADAPVGDPARDQRYSLAALAQQTSRLTKGAAADRGVRPTAKEAADEETGYTVNVKALQRWAAERLTLEPAAGGATRARFRYDGTTCTNLGRPLTFLYDVTLGPPEDGHTIREQTCAPAAGDTGHRGMCQFLANREALMAAIGGEKPLLGMPLERALTWHRAATGAGCYCDADSREHKWGLVLETIHYALHGNGTNGNTR
jgi:hypothetical protein